MTATKIYKWIKEKLAITSRPQLHLKNLTGRINAIFINKNNELPSQQLPVLLPDQTELRLPDSETNRIVEADSNPIKLKTLRKEILLQPDQWTIFRGYRVQIAKSLGAIGLGATLALGGNQYMKANTNEIYHVYVKDQEIGAVSSPDIVEEFKLAKYKEVLEQNPGVHMMLNVDEVTLRSEKAFNLKANDSVTLERLDKQITATAIGVQLVVNDTVYGVLKDRETAEQVLERIKLQYTGSNYAKEGKAFKLFEPSPETELQPGQSELAKVEFVQKVDLKQIELNPSEIGSPDEIFTTMQTGNVQPMVYTVTKGDCIGCIAQKLGVSTQFIYNNNPDLVDDRIKEGQQLNLTVDQPKLTVRTVERLVESEEVQHDTEFIKDDNARVGVTETLKEGSNGLKNVSFLITKENGQMVKEEMIDEQIIIQPVTSVVRKGTKVVLGEGTGKFAWPVLSSSLSSGFGLRWGKLHKGIDLASNNRNIMAVDNGKVITAGYKSDYGNYIVLDHMNGYHTLYGHLSQINVTVGKIVEKGEKIGYMGSTGDSTGIHLHFEVIRNGVVENPLKYLSR